MKFDDTRDFPYYRHNPRIPKKWWIILLLLIPVSMMVYAAIAQTSELIGSSIFCLMLLIPLLYVSNWDYNLLFKKPTRNEIILAVLMFAGYIAYSFIVATLLENLGLIGTGFDELLTIDFESTAALLFSIMAEELIKFIPLMFFLRLFYKYTDNRKLSIALSSAIIIIFFGLLHYAPPYSTLISVLALQGFGTIFELYGYIRTKNVLVPYISHLLTDGIIFIMIFLGVG
ncbi:hypothetical protein [Methanobrevibacter sp.]|uniref:hypothetical protein n=1 Tax=Methanobrevibacter sp. TaxID=66852 RepID=UPI00388E1A4C